MKDQLKKVIGPAVVILTMSVLVVLWGTFHGNKPDGTAADQCLAYGRLAGLLAAFGLFFLLLSMGKKRLIETIFPKPWLIRLHRNAGALVLILISLHFILIFLGHAQKHEESFGKAVSAFLFDTLWGSLTGIGVVLFLAIMIFSWLFLWKKMTFPAWRKTHYLVFPMLILVFFHQIFCGNDFQTHRWLLWLWVAAFAGGLLELFISKIRSGGKEENKSVSGKITDSSGL